MPGLSPIDLSSQKMYCCWCNFFVVKKTKIYVCWKSHYTTQKIGKQKILRHLHPAAVTEMLLSTSEMKETLRSISALESTFHVIISHLMLFYYPFCMWLSYWWRNKYSQSSQSHLKRGSERLFADKKSRGNCVLKIN